MAERELRRLGFYGLVNVRVVRVVAGWAGLVAAGGVLGDLPATLVDVGVAAPADQDEVVEVGGSVIATPPSDVVDLGVRHGCLAADAVAVAGDDGGALAW